MGWEEYVGVVLARLSEEIYGDLMLEMKNLREEDSLSDYQREFEHVTS